MEWNHFQTSRQDDLEDAVAITGISCKFPGAATPEAFWENLRHGVESITFFADDRLEASGVSRRLRENPNYVKAGAVIEDIDRFDAEFFDYTPVEAALIDPQQRIFLEQAWLALEDAGYDSGKYPGSAGVFAGTGLNAYFHRIGMNHPHLLEEGGGSGAALAGEKDFLATRVSYKCDLTGPSLTVQTAGSTALVAVHLACQSIRGGECDLAIAGGVSVRIPQQTGYLYREGSAFSRDGHCRAFDAGAAGAVPGNGAGVVVLKRLSTALDEGDRIYAVIRGSALNNDGALKAEFTVPSMERQAMVIRKALTAARVDPASVTYVETHGAGIPLNDAIEIKALTQAYGNARAAGRRCAIGSVKTNIGHLDAAAGVAGLIKTVLALQNREIPPSLNFDKPHPGIAFESSPFFVNTRLTKWERNGSPRRAGVSSFGIGGTNAHLILEEAPERNRGTEARTWQLFILSARNSAALIAQAINLKNLLLAKPGLNLADAAFTLQVGRRDFSHRIFFICRDQREAVAALDDFLSNGSPAAGRTGVALRVCEERDLPVVFLLPGESDQKTVYGAELYQNEPCFRENIDGCADLIFELMQTDLRRILYPELRSESSRDYSFGAQELPVIIRTALFASQYALARLWMEWGVQPGTLAGLDWLGETVALCLAGVLTLEEALTVAIDGQTNAETGISLNRAQVPVIFGLRPGKTPARDPDLPLRRSGNHRMNNNLNMLVKDSRYLVLRIGPSPLLSEDWGRERDNAVAELAFVASMLEDESAFPDGAETAALLRKIGQLWLAGARIDWNGLHVHERRERISLPGYPLQRKRFWFGPAAEGEDFEYIKAVPGAGDQEVAALQENRE